MKRKHFEASVCRESDQHDWRWFVTWQEDDEWVSCIFDATPEGLDQAMRSHEPIDWLNSGRSEMVDAYLHAASLNDTIHRLDWNAHFPLYAPKKSA